MTGKRTGNGEKGDGLDQPKPERISLEEFKRRFELVRGNPEEERKLVKEMVQETIDDVRGRVGEGGAS